MAGDRRGWQAVNQFVGADEFARFDDSHIVDLRRGVRRRIAAGDGVARALSFADFVMILIGRPPAKKARIIAQAGARGFAKSESSGASEIGDHRFRRPQITVAEKIVVI